MRAPKEDSCLVTGAWIPWRACLRADTSERVAGNPVSWFLKMTITRCDAAWLCAPATAAPPN